MINPKQPNQTPPLLKLKQPAKMSDLNSSTALQTTASSLSKETQLNLDDNKQPKLRMDYMMNDHGFIPWNREMVTRLRYNYLTDYSLMYDISDIYFSFNDLKKLLFGGATLNETQFDTVNGC